MGKGEIRIDGLIWDDFNVTHIAKHEVCPEEVEEASSGGVIVNLSHSGRLLIIGRTGEGRMLAIVLHEKEKEHWYYVVTARPASRKERSEYDSKITDNDLA